MEKYEKGGVKQKEKQEERLEKQAKRSDASWILYPLVSVVNVELVKKNKLYNAYDIAMLSMECISAFMHRQIDDDDAMLYAYSWLMAYGNTHASYVIWYDEGGNR